MKILIGTVIIVDSLFLIGCSREHRYDRASVVANIPVSAAVNLNSATADELEKLPHIGETLARRIVEFREENGPFRRPENLLLVDGISENKFQDIRPLIKTE